MERALDVRTAEAIAVRYELAGLGSRFLALCIDMVLQSAVALAVVLLLGVFALPVARAVAWLHLDKTVYVAALSVLALAIFALFFGYFIVFELVWNGQTPGKRALGIRVVRDGGFPVDAGAAVIRNVVRAVEVAFGFYVISAFVALLSPENKRPGDFAAGTIVVRDEPGDLPVLDAVTFDEPHYDDGLDAHDHALIAQFLARRATLEPCAAGEIAARIAARVRPKLRASFHFLSDLDLLEHLAVMGSRSRGTG
ncbi:MAG: RDD family protein [Candidatus Lustribacter sp.]